MANALDQVQATFTSLDGSYNLLLAACTTPDQRTALENRYSDAQKAYQTCFGQILSDDDVQVAALCTQLQAANNEIRNAVAAMGDMSKVIDAITNAVKVGAQLCTAAGI